MKLNESTVTINTRTKISAIKKAISTDETTIDITTTLAAKLTTISAVRITPMPTKFLTSKIGIKFHTMVRTKFSTMPIWGEIKLNE